MKKEVKKLDRDTKKEVRVREEKSKKDPEDYFPEV